MGAASAVGGEQSFLDQKFSHWKIPIYEDISFFKKLIIFGQINFQEKSLLGMWESWAEFFVPKQVKHEIESLSPLQFWLFFRSSLGFLVENSGRYRLQSSVLRKEIASPLTSLLKGWDLFPCKVFGFWSASAQAFCTSSDNSQIIQISCSSSSCPSSRNY